MKRFFALLMVIALLVTFSACGNLNQQAANTSESTETPTTTVTQKPAHTHSYTSKVTPATCTERGYTTYTCSCGDTYTDNYTNPSSHNYSKYKCTECGAIDKEHAYDYLMVWVKENGTTNGDDIKFEYTSLTGVSYSLSYYAENDVVCVTRIEATEEYFLFTTLYLDTFFYGCTYESLIMSELVMSGHITPGTFNSTAEISYEKFNEDSSLSPTMTRLTRECICDLLDWLEWCLSKYNIGLELSDLGFTSY